MNYRIAIAISFIVNLSIIAYAHMMHSIKYLDKSFIKAIEDYLYIAPLFCLPWLIAFLLKTKANMAAANIFSILSVCSCLFLFIPPPLIPSDAISFVVIMQIFVSYILLFISVLIGKFAISLND